ncbi:predicted protein [Postia placenta Mad-698-R]|uniref:Uncharacterized protein n=1 Tax=Postia placenta MAD-698-R-SB12 TaxID=670580 RepID=A0A1X6N717_9APHY|nr:hypothetical protein POSPLADRAFT_1137363 [Postia placenta MAD-698-R-SB12]EED80927.1 predicted protein [Postia placenta Mad-698-R]OSX64272.1 hypothetical protein POSPLADRAFT_1137363 [Postia placenta MAD-698-R-SB12]
MTPRRTRGTLANSPLLLVACPRSTFEGSAEYQRLLTTVIEESDEKTRIESAFTLPERIRARKEETSRQRSVLAEHRSRVQTLVTQINEIHPRLEEQLLAALATLPPLLDAARTAHADVLALTLEAALLKLSVLRARAHIALYGHAAPSNPRATMARALAAAQEKLRAKQRAQEDEERALDAQLAAYEGALGFVGGREGGITALYAHLRLRAASRII